ncbi:hypothetical protein ISCGN_012203 [Ixodes scapularis]
MLFIEPVELLSGGNYTCVVKNRAGLDSYTTFLDVEAPPKWVQTIGDGKIAYGSEAKLQCQASGSPVPTVRWQRFDEASQTWLTFNAVGESLVIPRVTLNETGRYRCSADNGVSPSVEHTLTVAVYDAPKIQPFSFPHRLKVQSKTSVTCIATDGTPPFAFSWLKDGVEVTTLKNIRREKKENDYSVLIIEPVEAINSGNYTCIVKNKAGFDSHTAYLEVEAPPTWKSVPKNVDVVEGEPLVVSCHAHGSPTPKVTWMFKKEAPPRLNPAKRVGVQSAKSKELQRTMRSISWILETKVSRLLLVVLIQVATGVSSEKVSPKIIAFHFRKTIKPGENARTTCLVEAGDAPMTFSWLRNGVAASLTRNVQIQSHADYSILNVNPVDATSAGNFTCIVKNKAGFDSFTAYLDVEAPPEWKREPADKTGVLGSNVDIDCWGTGSPAPKITWHHVKEDGAERPIDEIFQSRAVTYLNGTLRLHELQVGDSGSYTCTADNGVPPVLKKTVSLKIHAAKSERQLIGKSVQQHHSTVHPNGTLVLSYLGIDDMGQYVCEADNGVKPSLQKIITIRVNAAPTWKTLASDKAVVWNETLHLDCPAVGYPKPQLSFKKKSANGGGQEWVQITETDRHTIHQNGTIIIRRTVLADAGSYLCEAHNGVTPNARHIVRIVVNEPVEISNAGNYTCIAKNRAGFDSFTAYLDVQAPPLWKKRPEDVRVNIGHRAIIECLATGSPTPKIKWRKQQKEGVAGGWANLHSSVHLKMHDNGTLILEEVSAADGGQYSCEADNGIAPSATLAFSVIVNAAPSWKKKAEDVRVNSGAKARIECLATGSPTPRIKWRKQAKESKTGWADLESSNLIKPYENGTLVIEDVSTAEGGQYSCEADNGMAPSATLMFSITVNGESKGKKI